MPVTKLSPVALLVGLAAICWASAEILASFLSPGMSLFQVVWMRYGIHLVFLLAVTVPRSGRAIFRTKRLGLQIGRGLLMVVMPVSFIVSLGRVRTNDLMTLFWLAPLAMLALARVLQQDRPPALVWAMAVLAAVGVAILLHPSSALPLALGYAVGMGGSFSLYVVLTRTLKDDGTATNLFYSALAVFVPMTLVVPFFWQTPTARDMLVMVAIGLSGLAFLWAVDHASSRVAISTSAGLYPLQAVVALVVFPALFAGEHPGKRAAVGTLLVLAAAAGGLVLSARGDCTR